MTLQLDAETIGRSVAPGDAVRAVRRALRTFDPDSDIPRSVVEVRGGQYLLMPADLGEFAGVKVTTVTPDNPAGGRPRIQASYLLHDAVTHELLAILDGTALTTLRTPAVSVAAVQHVLQQRFPDGARVLVFGAGPQAVAHLQTLAAVVPVRGACMAVRDPGRYPGPPAPVLGAALGPVQILAAVDADPSHADIVVTATTSATPVLDGAAVAEHAVVIAVGSHEPDRRELDGQLLARCTVVVESVPSALRECGDVVMAVGEGELDPGGLIGMRRFVIDAHQAPAGPVVFKSSGMSWEDLVIAALAYRRCR